MAAVRADDTQRPCVRKRARSPGVSMFPTPAPPIPTQHPPRGAWRRAYSEVVADPRQLARELELDPELVAEAAARSFALRVPRAFLARIERGNPRDPLLIQVLPGLLELEERAGFGIDPVAEIARSPQPGLIHKYQGRVLWVLTGACAIHCRYCFRRHFPYGDHLGGIAGRLDVLEHLRRDPTIREVILSGGDPLSLDDAVLGSLAAELAAIPQLERLRVHTRLPVVIPERVDTALVGWLTATRLRSVVVLHVNHAREIDGAVAAAVGRLVSAGVTVLNQAVLLAAVNDSVEALTGLSERLFEIGVLPYYLHQLDRVAGAAHFEVSDKRAVELMAQVAARLPGYLVPRLVRDDGESAAKIMV